jgi:hypothetical protein
MADFSNLSIEKAVIACVLRDKGTQDRIITGHKLSPSHFSNLVIAGIMKCVLELKQEGAPITIKLIGTRLRDALKDDVAHARTTVETIKEVLKGISEASLEPEAFEFYVDELDKLADARRMKKMLDESYTLMQNGDVVAAKSLIADSSLDNYETLEINEGDLAGDIVEVLGHIREAQIHPERFIPIPTGLPLYDDVLDGSMPKETTLIIGGAKRGKSLLLMEVGYQAMIRGKFVVHFTIEMDKMSAENRILSRATNAFARASKDCEAVPFSHFRNPTKLEAPFSKADFDVVTRTGEWIEKTGGRYYVVSFRGRSCTIPKGYLKLHEIERKFGRRVDLVTWDYLNDIQPIGRFDNAKDWTAIGEVSWDMTQMAKHFRHFDEPKDSPTGVPVWTANQAKPGAVYEEELGVQAAAYSPLPIQHSDVVVFLAQTKEDKRQGPMGILRFGITVARFANYNETAFLYPNYPYCLIHDPEMAKILGEKK